MKKDKNFVNRTIVAKIRNSSDYTNELRNTLDKLSESRIRYLLWYINMCKSNGRSEFLYKLRSDVINHLKTTSIVGEPVH